MELYFFPEKSLTFKGLPCVVQKSSMEEKVSKFSQNYKFREVFFKKGCFFFGGEGRGKILNLQGQNLFRGAPRHPAPMEESQDAW